MNWVIVRSVIVGSLRNSLHFCNTMKLCTAAIVYCIGYTMFRLNRGQEGLMPLVGRLLAFV